MGKIIAIFGPHGVGKTSLQMYAQNKGLNIKEGFEFPNNIDDCSTWDKFWNYQMKYWVMVKKQLDEIRLQEGLFVVSRSFEEQLYYLRCHPISQGHENIINEFESRNKQYKSDFLFYFDASFKTLNNRIKNDPLRDLCETRWWYRDRFFLYDKINKNQENIHIIDTSEITTEELYEKMMKIINKEALWLI